MIIKNFTEGGWPGMFLIYVLWILVIFLAVRLYLSIKAKKLDASQFKKRNEQILFYGSLSFFIGILWQLLGLFDALNAIEAAGDISPALVFGGFKISLIAPAYGFVLFILSFIIWFVFRNSYKG